MSCGTTRTDYLFRPHSFRSASGWRPRFGPHVREGGNMGGARLHAGAARQAIPGSKSGGSNNDEQSPRFNAETTLVLIAVLQ